MPGPRSDARTRSIPGPRPDRQTANARTAARNAGNGAAEGAPRPEETGNGARRGPDGQAASKAPEGALRDLFRGLRAGDLETVLLTVAMAADENRMPSADPDEAERILAFLARLAEHDAPLPLPPPDGSGLAPNRPSDPD